MVNVGDSRFIAIRRGDLGSTLESLQVLAADARNQANALNARGYHQSADIWREISDVLDNVSSDAMGALDSVYTEDYVEDVDDAA